MKALTLLVASAIVLICLGCEAFTPPVQTKTITPHSDGAGPSLKIIDFNANRRASYVYTDGNGKVTLATEPPPDTVLDTLVEGAIKANETGGEGSGKVELTAKTIDRALSVTLFRDMSFRLAEMHANGSLDQANYRHDLATLTKGILDLAKAELATAETRKAEAVTKQLEKAESFIREAELKGASDEELRKMRIEFIPSSE